jgi:uncharacterized protein
MQKSLMSLRIRLCPEELSVCRLAHTDPIPEWVLSSTIYSITKTGEELSLVCSTSLVPAGVKSEGPWVALQIEGPIPFTLTGVLASVLDPLAKADVSIFCVSTFDTDYVMVKAGDTDRAMSALRDAGHRFS